MQLDFTHQIIIFIYQQSQILDQVFKIDSLKTINIQMIKFAQVLEDIQQEGEIVVKSLKKDFVYIRKENREKIFNKRRKVQEIKYQEYSQYEEPASQQKINDYISKKGYDYQRLKVYYQRKYEISDLQNLFKLVKQDNIEHMFQGVIGIRRILSIQKKPPIQEILDQGLLQLFLNLIKNHPHPQMRTQSAWIIANLCSGTSAQCAKIIEANTLQIIVDLLNEKQLGLIEQLIWILGNIASDTIVNRNLILNLGAIPKIVKIISDNPNLKDLIKHSCWALSNMCRGNPLPSFQLVKEAIQKLAYVAAGDQISDEETFTQICWAISNFTDSSKKRSYFIIQNNLIYKIIPIILDKQSKEIIVPCIRILGGLTTGSPEDVSELFKTNCLEAIQKLLAHKNKTIRREGAWVLSNIAASNLEHTQHILSDQILLKIMIKILKEDSEQIRKEIIFVFSNMCHSCKQLDLDYYYYELGLVTCYYDLLRSNFKIIVNQTLESLSQVLRFSQNKMKKRQEKTNYFAQKLKEHGVTTILQDLQNHESDEIYELVTVILTSYYTLQDPLSLSPDQRKQELSRLSFKNTQLPLKDKTK